MDTLTNSNLLNAILDSNIPNTDSIGNFKMFCSKEPKDNFSKTIRGVIFENDKLVHRGFPYSEDVDVNDEDSVSSLLSRNFRACLSHEGTVLRMIYFGGQWNMTTHRRLDATKSKWGSSESFGNIFKNAIKVYFKSYDDFLLNLDREKHYHFLLKSTEETRIVVYPQPLEPVILTAITCAKTFDLLPLEPVGDIPIAKTLFFETVTDVKNYVLNCDPFVCQGIIFFSKDMQESVRIANPDYLKYVSVRDNISSLHVCYACNRLKEEKELFFKLYASGESIGKAFEEKLQVIAKDLHRLYISRYVHKKQFRLSQQRHAVLNAIHSYYLKTVKPKNKGIYFEDVLHVLNNQKPIFLHRLVKGKETFVIFGP